MFTKWQLGQGRQRWAPNPQWWIRRRRCSTRTGDSSMVPWERAWWICLIHDDTWESNGIWWNWATIYLHVFLGYMTSLKVGISPIPANDRNFCRWKTLIKLRYLGVYPIFNIKRTNQYCNRCGFILWLWPTKTVVDGAERPAIMGKGSKMKQAKAVRTMTYGNESLAKSGI